MCRRSSSLFKSLSLCARLCVYVCRRIELQLVSNSIGVAQMEWGGEGEAEGPRGAGATGVIAAMRFYWGDGAGGSPSAILHPNIPAHLDSAQSSGAAAAKAGGGGYACPGILAELRHSSCHRGARLLCRHPPKNSAGPQTTTILLVGGQCAGGGAAESASAARAVERGGVA